jgi:hypothetical protein
MGKMANLAKQMNQRVQKQGLMRICATLDWMMLISRDHLINQHFA